MGKKRLPYREGTWFAVPLCTTGYAVGVIARSAGNGPVFGYFFGPKRDDVPELATVAHLDRRDAIWIGQFGDLGLLEGEWPVIGDAPNWNRDDWPLPPFIRVDRISGKAVKVIYSDDLSQESEEPCDPSLVSQYPEDALSGSGAVEITL